ncbi:hypothetical protein KGV55_01780 [Candidatus Gracilibacteria bacterium]|nr:hypothetical protein [Candidatus Gracilibacteria bacterium]
MLKPDNFSGGNETLTGTNLNTNSVNLNSQKSTEGQVYNGEFSYQKYTDSIQNYKGEYILKDGAKIPHGQGLETATLSDVSITDVGRFENGYFVEGKREVIGSGNRKMEAVGEFKEGEVYPYNGTTQEVPNYKNIVFVKQRFENGNKIEGEALFVDGIVVVNNFLENFTIKYKDSSKEEILYEGPLERVQLKNKTEEMSARSKNIKRVLEELAINASDGSFSNIPQHTREAIILLEDMNRHIDEIVDMDRDTVGQFLRRIEEVRDYFYFQREKNNLVSLREINVLADELDEFIVFLKKQFRI